MTYQTFTGDPVARRRYWARSHLGWRTIARAAPNAGHRAVAALQRRGLLDRRSSPRTSTACTRPAAPGDVIELHGSLDRVVCLDCGDADPRGPSSTGRLDAANPGFAGRGHRDQPGRRRRAAPTTRSPASGRSTARACGGMLKPDVVFFGETVPPDRVRRCFALVEAPGRCWCSARR